MVKYKDNLQEKFFTLKYRYILPLIEDIISMTNIYNLKEYKQKTRL